MEREREKKKKQHVLQLVSWSCPSAGPKILLSPSHSQSTQKIGGGWGGGGGGGGGGVREVEVGCGILWPPGPPKLSGLS